MQAEKTIKKYITLRILVNTRKKRDYESIGTLSKTGPLLVVFGVFELTRLNSIRKRKILNFKKA